MTLVAMGDVFVLLVASLTVIFCPWLAIYHLLSILIQVVLRIKLGLTLIVAVNEIINFYIIPAFILQFNTEKFLLYATLPYFLYNFGVVFYVLTTNNNQEVVLEPVDLSSYCCKIKQEELCPVCLEQGVDAQLPCGHYLHSSFECFRWTLTHNQCCVCRKNVK